MRKVNEHILEEDFAPAIPITHLMAEIQSAGSQLFSSIDIQHAFFSLHIKKGTEDATAFYADTGTNLSSWGENLSGRWVFKRCVMGAQPSSAALYKAMSFALQGVSDVVIYCDDLFMHSVTRSQHFEAIRRVLGRLKKYGLKIAPKKCKFMHKNLTFLGYNISGEGIRPEKDKLEHLQNIQYPTNVKEIRSFLGFVNFFHKFIPNSSYFSSQLTALTRKNSARKGGELPKSAKLAFDHLKNFLLKSPTLYNPDPVKRMYLIADASKGSSKVKGMIGWAVVQKGKNPGEWLPIVFGSRTLTEAEMNYPINQLEQLAIVCGYRDCYYLLYGRPTTIFCDNKPSLHRAAKEEKRFMIPLGSLINDTRSKVEFRPGNENTVPDFLSRYHAPEINAVQGPITGREIYLEKIKEHQNNDNEICHIKDQINKKVNLEDIDTEHFRDVVHNMHILNGILFVREDGSDKAVIPYNDREKYVINTHLDPMLGHVGREKLADRISLRAYVIGLGSIIKDITETCGRCIQTSEKHHKTEHEPIHPMPVPNNMFNRWHIDLTGPFKENNSKFYVIGAIDALTKYMVGGIIPDKTALSVSNYILHEIINKFGVPNAITTDRGNEFHNELSRHLGEVYGITRIRTSPYHPAANGEIEIRWRFIKNL